MSAADSTAAKRAPSPRAGAEPPRFLAVEGPLRVGKTTLARILAERLHARRIYDCEDNPFLADFYGEKPGAAFRAQMYFLLERQRRLRDALAIEAPGPVLSDFLMEKDRIFANLNLAEEFEGVPIISSERAISAIGNEELVQIAYERNALGSCSAADAVDVTPGVPIYHFNGVVAQSSDNHPIVARVEGEVINAAPDVKQRNFLYETEGLFLRRLGGLIEYWK